MKEKAIIFDASTIITFSMNGFLPKLKKLKEVFGGKFLITEDVRREVVDKPMKINRFKLEAMGVEKLIREKVLEMPSSVKVNDNVVSQKTEELKQVANNLFEARGKFLHLIDSGEASCLALSRILTDKGVQNVVAVDERTMRMLGEKPKNVQELMERKLHTKVVLKKENFGIFEGFKFIRSAELIYIAYKKKLFDLKNGVLEALLYAVKSKGCAISGNEIKEIVRIGK
jgi:hypothetical protein